MKRWMSVAVVGVLGAWLVAFFVSVVPDLWHKARQREQRACYALGPDIRHPFTEPNASHAPSFSLPTLQGTTVELTALRGKSVLLNFWASWCAPCRTEMPALEQLQRTFPNELVVIAINEDEDIEAARRFFPQGTPLRVVHDPKHTVAQQYGAFQYPESFLLDAKGRVHKYVQGDPETWNTEETRICIRSLNST